jgi:hypothetical protein
VNPQEVAVLLRYAASLDRWLKETDQESAQVMVIGWSSILADVPFAFAERTVRDHYATPDARSIAPGDVLTAWRSDLARSRERDAAAHRATQQQTLDAAAPPDQGVFGSATQYLADMMAVVAEGGDPSTVVRPAGVRVRTLSPEAEARERACRFPDICVCTHMECRDGWLDVETTRRSVLGQDCEEVTRCPQCDDALQMAQERGIARKPRRTAGAR